jgi:hypothetical protein
MSFLKCMDELASPMNGDQRFNRLTRHHHTIVLESEKMDVDQILKDATLKAVQTGENFGHETDTSRLKLRILGVVKVLLGLASFVGLWFLAIAVKPKADTDNVVFKGMMFIGIACTCIVCVGLFQLLAGMRWTDAPKWLRIMFLVVVVPIVVFIELMAAIQLNRHFEL